MWLRWLDLSGLEDCGILGVVVKCVEIWRNIDGEGSGLGLY